MYDGFIHIAKSTTELPSIVDGMKGHENHNTQYGHGLAGGGFGCYIYCEDCDKIVGKDIEQESL